VACPGETEIATLVGAFVQTTAALSTPDRGGPPPLQRARLLVDDLMGTYLASSGKSRWCDKSLSNVLHLDQLASAWPDSRFVLLHRHCMDVVMSGIEASPWGLDSYGFGQFAQMSPTNTVMALVGYWIERTATMLAFEERFPDRCLRLRYEDLVTSTGEVVERIWEFIGVADVAGTETAAFAVGHDPYAPADHKIWHTGAVHRESIGRGSRVPPKRVSGAARTTMNELLARLDYPTVDDGWGSGGTARPEGWDDGPEAPVPGEPVLVELRVVEGSVQLWSRVVDLSTAASGGPRGGPPATGGAQQGPLRVVAVERGALGAICAGTENVGAALRARTVRYYGPIPQNFEVEREMFERLVPVLKACGWR
jgi:hypothetical protein